MVLNSYMTQLFDELAYRGVPFPLELTVTLAEIRELLAGEDPDSPGPSPIRRACATLAAALAAEGVPDPLNQPITIGMIWLDLCDLVGEMPPPYVEAMLDTPAAWPLSAGSGVTHAARRVVVRSGRAATVPKKGGGEW